MRRISRQLPIRLRDHLISICLTIGRLRGKRSLSQRSNWIWLLKYLRAYWVQHIRIANINMLSTLKVLLMLRMHLRKLPLLCLIQLRPQMLEIASQIPPQSPQITMVRSSTLILKMGLHAFTILTDTIPKMFTTLFSNSSLKPPPTLISNKMSFQTLKLSKIVKFNQKHLIQIK